MTALTLPFAVQPNEGQALPTPTGDSITIKANTEQTNGSLTIMELVVAPKSGPALHSHLREDELWWVLEGDFRFKAGDLMLHASTGGMAFGPRRTPHCFQNVGEAPGRLLVVTAPSGAERFFEEFAEVVEDAVGAADARGAAGPGVPERLFAVGMANWIEFIGPPVGISDPL